MKLTSVERIGRSQLISRVIRAPHRIRRSGNEEMTPASKAGVSSILAFALSCMAAVGAPPSEFVQEPSVWLRLEPAMFPALLLGVLLALAALLLAPFVPRMSAMACIGAAMSSMLGVLVGWGIDAEAAPRGLLLPIALLAVPLLGAAESLREAPQGQQ